MNTNKRPHGIPTIDSLHVDIGHANTYRLEVIKAMLGITTALLAFTVSFRPKLVEVSWEWLKAFNALNVVQTK